MQIIEAILFEPVGCLAEFPSEEFNEVAVRLFKRRKKASKSGSRSYWHLLNLIQDTDKKVNEKMVEAFEVQAVDKASVYEDVVPALSELKAMGIKLIIASSLSNAATTRFLEKFGLGDLFSAVWNRDSAEGIKGVPLTRAIDSASLKPQRVMFLTDTAEGLKVANSLGLNSILMMNDPDEARRLSMHDPAGGIVSLHELPDFIRLVAAENARETRR
jgi:FMN phosphatase YigB (HAD superfamily)